MAVEAVPSLSTYRDAPSRLVRAGLLTGVTDGLFSSVLAAAFYGSTVTRLWQGVASVLLGPSALEGGAHTALIGVLMHFGVAFGWSAVFLFVIMRLPFVRALLGTRYGTLAVAAIYGPFIWMMMSLVIIPLFTHRPPTINYRWWIQFFGHVPFVALPMVAMIGRRER
jgi:hypothetical protein